MRRTPLGPEALEIGGNIRRERRRLGLTGDAVRDLTGIHPTSLSFIERGMQEPSGEQLRSLARAFGCRLSKLLGSTLRASPRRLSARQRDQRAAQG